MLNDLLFTLDLARKSLPADADPVHTARLSLIERMVRCALEKEPDYWRGAEDEAEQRADDAAMRRLRGEDTSDTQ